MIKKIFINPIEHRLRAGWRIILFIIIMVGIARLLGFTVNNLFGGMPEDKTLKFFFIILIAAISGTTGVIIVRRYIDKKTMLSFGLKIDSFAIKDWLYGFLLSLPLCFIRL